MKSFVRRLTSKASNGTREGEFVTAPEGKLFPATNPVEDGEECLHDCDSCTVRLPSKWSIDEDDRLYGHVKGWQTHLIVATGKTDWVRDVADEKGSCMEAVEKCGVSPSNGRLMLSASNMPVPDQDNHKEGDTRVLLLPSFVYIDHVNPSNVAELIKDHLDRGPTNTTPLVHSSNPTDSTGSTDSELPTNGHEKLPGTLLPHSCPHRYLILLCSHKTRDARCGQSAPLLRKEFERHLRPLGLYRDLLDERPGGAGIYFINHVGGHKYSANVMIYRRGDSEQDGIGRGEASQCMWLARVRPEDCENIVRYTLLQGKLVKPASQLRGGFDREKGLVSW